MSIVSINSNVSSLMTQRRLGENSAALNRAFEHLSSGQRITRASEDAAGLAIASSLNVDTRVYNQGVRNLNDGISALDIADGAISELTNIVTRLQELAEQAANGTLGKTQRGALDAEAQELSDEYFRIAQTASFNGQKLFDGSLQGLSLQAAYGSGGTLLSSMGGKIGTGVFETAVSYTIGSGSDAAALGDLNGDGNLDMVTSQNGAASTSVLLGNGDGTFKARVSYGTGITSGVALGDLNGDGVLDIVSSNYNNAAVSVMLGNGDGTFQARTSFTAPTGPYSIALADMNGDGAADLVSANVSAGSVSVFLGNGNGSFKAKTDLAGGSFTAGIALGDTNGDGVMDIVASNLGTANASVYLGNGNGTFKTLVNYVTGASPQNVTLGDVNGDDILDLVSANYGGASASVLIGNGNGTFKAKVDYTTAASAFGVSLGDVNGDGFEDIITSNDGAAGSISVLIGNGNGTFRAKTDYSTAAHVRVLGIGDLNGDGVIDIVTPSNTTTNASVLIGRTQDGVAPLLSFSLKTQAAALQALPVFKNTVKNLAAQRGTIGANLSRVGFAANVLSTSAENYTVAESQIRDADVAYEVANLTRGRILQQASAAVLAQANLEPQIALSLLQGK